MADGCDSGECLFGKPLRVAGAVLHQIACELDETDDDEWTETVN